ncbi:MAG: CocE/NonD family hydrolase [Hymenobacter sp.]
MFRPVLLSVLLAAALARPAAAQTAPTPPAPRTPSSCGKTTASWSSSSRCATAPGWLLFCTCRSAPAGPTPTPSCWSGRPTRPARAAPDNYATRGPGPSRELSQEKYIFVYQDVRGRYLSEGQFEEMAPALPPGSGRASKGKNAAHDESTDTYDTIEWVLKHVPNNNGRVGMMGISYPGFYASASLPNAHPALKAVSPAGPGYGRVYGR